MGILARRLEEGRETLVVGSSVVGRWSRSFNPGLKAETPKPQGPRTKDQRPKTKVVQNGLESLLVPPAAGIYARST